MSGPLLPAGTGHDASGCLTLGGCTVAELLCDNLERMLYQTPFAPFVLDAERPLERCDVVGRHCETGDRLVQGALLATPEIGDTIIVPVTGAYCYSTQNNYNGACRPPVVLCKDRRARIIVWRERIDDLLARACDLPAALPETA